MVSANAHASLRSAAAQAKDSVDGVVLRAKQATGLLRPLRAWPYLGHGTPHVAYIKGRVSERTGVDEQRSTDSRLQNLTATVRRFTATPVPGARVLITLAGDEVEVHSDAEGFFRATMRPHPPLEAGWHDLSATLVATSKVGGSPSRKPTFSRLLVPPGDASFGIISDLDDTVVRSEVTRPLRAALTMLLSNATTRTPFQGVAEFYRALQAGPTGAGSNPLFYVSSGPWNLHDLLMEFLQAKRIPAGPLFLRAWGLDADARPGGGSRGHKSEVLRGLLGTYPRLPWVLIGDSGQQDPEIYRDLALAEPGRVVAVFIRDVTTPERDAQVHAVAAQVRQAGVAFHLVADTAEAAQHAAGLGLLTAQAVADVSAAVGRAESTAGHGTA